MSEVIRYFTVCVGTQMIPFIVPAKSICAISGYFDEELTPDIGFDTAKCPDAQPYYVYLPGDRPEIFELFLCWMLDIHFDVEGEEYDENGFAITVNVGPIVELYILAEKLHSPDCKQKVITYLWSRMERITDIPIESCELLIKRLAPDDALRQLIRDMILNIAALEHICYTLIDQVPEFGVYLMKGALQNSKYALREDWWRLNGFAYYHSRARLTGLFDYEVQEKGALADLEMIAYSPVSWSELLDAPTQEIYQMDLPDRTRVQEPQHFQLSLPDRTRAGEVP